MIKIRENKRYEKYKREEFEGTIQEQLPEGYVKFLEKYNGGVVEDGIGKYKDKDRGEHKFILDNLFGIGRENGLEYNYGEYKKRIKKGYIPIGMDVGGNLICMKILKEGKGEVFFWNHEEEESDNMYFIAETFEEFWEKLEYDGIDSKQQEVTKVWIDEDFQKELEKYK